MKILGLETSCDETSVAILELTPKRLNLLGQNTASQIKLHAKWGGVVPELAARMHAENIIPLLDNLFKETKTKPADLDLIAVTAGPGLITALQVGVVTAKTLAVTFQKPLIGVNHIAGHLVSPFLTTPYSLLTATSTYPAISLVVSGGHTELYLIKNIHHHKLLGKTLDDAAGEAFDKVAKMLKLPYPGGPQVSKLAKDGNPLAFNFPRPMLKNNDFNFSFSGLKTAVLYTLQKYKPSTISYLLKANLCASFQQAVIDVLIIKTLKAAEKYKAKTIMISGGVSANQQLRDQMTQKIQKLHPTPYTLYPQLQFTGDNAAMIALAGGLEAQKHGLARYKKTWTKLQAQANWELWN